jgi:hypothetical protein
MADITTFDDLSTGYTDTEAKKYMCHGKKQQLPIEVCVLKTGARKLILILG